MVAFFEIKNSTEIIGPFHNQGHLGTGALKIDSSSSSSIWEAGTASVDGDCQLRGQFELKTINTTFNADYYSGGNVLAGKGSISLPTTPLIYYVSLLNKQGLEVLHPKLYFTQAMHDEVRGKPDSLIRSSVFLAFSKRFSAKQILALTSALPALQQAVQHVLEQSPSVQACWCVLIRIVQNPLLV